MKTTLLFSFVLAAAGLAAPLLTRAALPSGSPAPDFSLTDLDGKVRSLSDYKGKRVVLEWNNPECPFVMKNYEKSGHLPALQSGAVAGGVVWLVINSGAPGKQGGGYTTAELRDYLKKNHAAPTAYLQDHDGRVGHLYGAKTTPHLFVIDAEGRIAYQGAIDSIRSADPADIARATCYVTAALEALKAGRPVEPTSTEPYGCSVKY